MITITIDGKKYKLDAMTVKQHRKMPPNATPIENNDFLIVASLESGGQEDPQGSLDSLPVYRNAAYKTLLEKVLEVNGLKVETSKEGEAPAGEGPAEESIGSSSSIE